VIGQSDVPGDTVHHGFLWQDGRTSDLGTLPGLPVSLANGINNQGQIVGFSQDESGNTTVPWIWQHGVMTDLNTLIPSDSPILLVEALGINDRGQITGFGDLSDGEQRVYLLTPMPDHSHRG
jgi:probable HAF family extracellular repeat protein